MNSERDSRGHADRRNRPSVLVVLPVYNEERILSESVHRLTEFLQRNDLCEWKVVIADNDSRDRTGDIGRSLSLEIPFVHYLHIPHKGCGIAVRTAWEQADCDFVNYMDIDLSTSLEALIDSVHLLNNGADIVVANRFDKKSVVRRCLKREIVSRCYNMILQFSLGVRFRDAHCGFKTARRDVALELLTRIEDNGFFFAAEFMFYGEKLGYRIAEIPVVWDEDLNTKANIIRDACDDLRGIYRLRFHNQLSGKKERQ